MYNTIFNLKDFFFKPEDEQKLLNIKSKKQFSCVSLFPRYVDDLLE